MFKFLRRWFLKKNADFEPCLKPVSRVFGFDRGTPVDRVFIESFIAENKELIKGQVLEVGETLYSKKFSHNADLKILSYSGSPSPDSIVGDLEKLSTLPENFADCFICTQTLNFIYDFNSAICGIRHLLKPGGTALVTVAGLTQISRFDMERWGDYWRFTDMSMRRAFSRVFGENNVGVCSYGNLKSAIGLLKGMAAEEFDNQELFVKDEDYQVVIAVRARK
ncbi:MAG: class I SAM-dependent methyltransferase [Candidatus Rifleibacteriota bacterium]